MPTARPLFLLATAVLATVAVGLRVPEPTDRCDRRAALIGAGTLATAAAAATTATVSPALAAGGGSGDSNDIVPASIPTWRFSRGVEFPVLALNTAGLSREGTSRAFRNAIDAGITHVEFHPGTERDGVAAVLPSLGKDRLSDVFLTTKIETGWERNPTPEVAAASVKDRLDADLAALGVDRIDMLMLRESPDPRVIQAMWKAMEAELESGRVRSLGVVNYCPSAIDCLLTAARHKPEVNYIQLHAGMGPMPAARAHGEERGIRTFAYGHLGERARPVDDTSRILRSPVLREIAASRSRPVESVALRWVLQTGAAASVRPDARFFLGKGFCLDPGCADGLRVSARTAAVGGDDDDWALSPREMRAIDDMRDPDSSPTLFSSPGCPGSFFSSSSG